MHATEVLRKDGSEQANAIALWKDRDCFCRLGQDRHAATGSTCVVDGRMTFSATL